MRPLSLTMTGFRSYTARTVIDFENKSSVAVIGDTGAGKSSILEAITYALYGRCSWNAVVQPLLADGAKAMQVDLTFSHDGQRWLASRSLRKGVATTNSIHRLENLETGARWDNAGQVNEKIKALLCMDHGAFESVVLLPQGRFGKLLEATDSVRTSMLQDLFGARELLTVRDLADARARAISTLLADARVSRASLLPDPAAAAAEAAELASAAEEKAGALGEALRSMTDLQRRAGQAAAVREAATAGADELARARVGDAGEVLAAVASVAIAIEQKESAAAAAVQQAQGRDSELDRRIQAVVEASAPVQDLRAAAAALADLPGILEGVHELDESIDEEQPRLEEQLACLEKDAAELQRRRGTVQGAERESGEAAAVAKAFRTKADGVGDYIAGALRAAEKAAQAASDLEAAKEHHGTCIDNVAPLREKAAAAQQVLDAAEQVLRDLNTSASVAVLAAHLHGGDDCPVCQRELPPGYQVPRSDAGEVAAAEQQRAKAFAEHRGANTELLKANAAVDAALAAVNARAADLTRAGEGIGAAVDAASKAYAVLAASVPAHAAAAPLPPLDSFRADLRQAADTIAQDAEHDSRHGLDAEPGLRAPLRAMAEALAQHAQQLATRAARIDAGLTTAETDLAGRRGAHERETAALAKQVKRRSTAVGTLSAKAASVPAYARAFLAEDVLQITTEAIAATQNAVAGRLRELESLDLEKKDAGRQIEGHRQALQVVRAEAATRVYEPLRLLHRRLEESAQTIRRIAQARLPHGLDLAALNADVHPPTVHSTRRFTDAVTAAAELLAAHLNRQASDAEADELRAGADFAAAAKALAAQTGIDVEGALGAADALHPLIAAEYGARTDAGRHREDHARAQGQIRQAGDLDYAITAGAARHAALEEVRRQLANSKFLAYLISRRTEALLRIASHTLGQLSNDQFGFATDFQIVSRGSGVVHGPERLSGGEKFLASLALALALVELHARGGPRLGALFLDEGFAALDASTLDTALAVLRDQAGGDRLVLAVSHLHTVAEAVDDVLWVERRSGGSTARWMTEEERDGLAEHHGDPGLL